LGLAIGVSNKSRVAVKMTVVASHVANPPQLVIAP
jgi:hypothetical protein